MDLRHVLVPLSRYDHIQQVWRSKGKWTLSNSRNKVINTDWSRQELSEYDVMTLAGHANFAMTHKFYFAVADDLIDRARQATSHQVSQELLQRCCRNNQKGTNQ